MKLFFLWWLRGASWVYYFLFIICIGLLMTYPTGFVLYVLILGREFKGLTPFGYGLLFGTLTVFIGLIVLYLVVYRPKALERVRSGDPTYLAKPRFF